MKPIASQYKLLMLFWAQVVINWLYILWITNQPDLVISGWIALTPLLGLIYFAFALMASIGIYNKSKQGLALAYCVIIFGTICAVISFGIITHDLYLAEIIIIPLIILNAIIIFYMALHRHTYLS